MKRVKPNTEFKEFSDEEMMVILKQILPNHLYEKVEFLALRHPYAPKISLQGFLMHACHQETDKWGRSLSSLVSNEKRLAKKSLS